MSLTAIIISVLALVAGVGVGYYLRLIISLGEDREAGKVVLSGVILESVGEDDLALIA
jgi:hypothetical protein